MWGLPGSEMAVSAPIEPVLGSVMRTVLLSRREEKVSATFFACGVSIEGRHDGGFSVIWTFEKNNGRFQVS